MILFCFVLLDELCIALYVTIVVVFCDYFLEKIVIWLVTSKMIASNTFQIPYSKVMGGIVGGSV